jgi:hypothetical protein
MGLNIRSIQECGDIRKPHPRDTMVDSELSKQSEQR